MKLALVSPEPLVRSAQKYYGCAPLGLMALAGYIRKNMPDITIKIIDGPSGENVDEEIYFFEPDVIGVTSTTPQAPDAYRLLDWLKNARPDIFTVMGGIHACYDDNTQVLTDEGWKFFFDITTNDKIATLDTEKKSIVYLNPIKVQKYTYKGKLIHFKNQRIDLLVTPEHKLYGRIVDKKSGKNHYVYTYKGEVKKIVPKPNFGFLVAKDLLSLSSSKCVEFLKDFPYTDNVCNDTIKIPVTPYLKKNGVPYSQNILELNLDAFLEFFGWYLAEGSCTLAKNKKSKNKHGNKYQISIANTNSQYIKEIAEVIKKMGFNPQIGRKRDVSLSSKLLFSFLKPLGYSHQKYIPDFIKKLPPSKLRILYNSYKKGDGHTDKKTMADEFSSTSRQLSYDIYAIAVKIGGVPSHTSIFRKSGFNHNGQTFYRVYVSWTKRFITAKVNQLFSVDYDGFVYDCTLPKHHLLFVSRNGKCVWSSNSVLPEEATQHADAVVVGEGETALLNILKALKQGEKPKGIFQSEPIQNLDDIPNAFDLIDFERCYLDTELGPTLSLRCVGILTSRGCSYGNCRFCYASSHHTKPRFLSAQRVVEDVMYFIKKYNVKSVFFFDDEFVANKKRLREIAALFEQYGINKKITWGCLARVNSLDEATLMLMKSMGCILIRCGFESSVPRLLRYLKGGATTVEQNERPAPIAHKLGITLGGSFIFGSPTGMNENFELDNQPETLAEMKSVLEWVAQQDGIKFMDYNTMVLYPKTKVWEYAKNHGLLPDDKCYTLWADKLQREDKYFIDKALTLKEYTKFFKNLERTTWVLTEVRECPNARTLLRLFRTDTFWRVACTHPKMTYNLIKKVANHTLTPLPCNALSETKPTSEGVS